MMFLNIKNSYLAQGLLALALFTSQSILSAAQPNKIPLSAWKVECLDKELSGLGLKSYAESAENFAVRKGSDSRYQELLMKISKEDWKKFKNLRFQKGLKTVALCTLGSMLVGGSIFAAMAGVGVFSARNRPPVPFLVGKAAAFGAIYFGAYVLSIMGLDKISKIIRPPIPLIAEAEDLETLDESQLWVRFPRLAEELKAEQIAKDLKNKQIVEAHNQMVQEQNRECVYLNVVGGYRTYSDSDALELSC